MLIFCKTQCRWIITSYLSNPKFSRKLGDLLEFCDVLGICLLTRFAMYFATCTINVTLRWNKYWMIAWTCNLFRWNFGQSKCKRWYQSIFTNSKWEFTICISSEPPFKLFIFVDFSQCKNTICRLFNSLFRIRLLSTRLPLIADLL